MPRQLTLGGLADESRTAEDLALPYLEGVDALPIVIDALDRAATERRGVAVVGERGAGKSEAFAVAVPQFAEAEAEKEDADANYRVRRVITLVAPRASAGAGTLTPTGRLASSATGRLPSYRAVVLALLGALLGAPPEDRVRGRRKTDQELVSETVQLALTLGVAVFGIEECERLGADGLTALRDVMADAAMADAERYAPGPTGARALRAGGLGIVAVGTPEFRTRLERSDEAGERWAGCVGVPLLSAADAPDVFRAWFPAFRDAERVWANRAGAGAWARYVTAAVARGRAEVSVRLLDNVARDYFRLFVRNHPDGVRSGAASAGAPGRGGRDALVPLSRETVPFDADLFAYAAGAANWHLVAPGTVGQAAGSTPAPESRRIRAADVVAHDPTGVGPTDTPVAGADVTA